eukprot:4825188-Prymnesium_polylepis.1
MQTWRCARLSSPAHRARDSLTVRIVSCDCSPLSAAPSPSGSHGRIRLSFRDLPPPRRLHLRARLLRQS